MKFALKIFFIFFGLQLCLFSPVLRRGAGGEALAQDYRDAGLWTTFNLEYTITSKFSGLLTQEARFKENISRLNLFYTDIGTQYKFSKNFKAALVYRHIDKFQDDNSYSFRHRVMLDLTFKHKFGKFTVGYRNRTQAEVRDVQSSNAGMVPEWYSRNKLGVKYDTETRFTPYGSVEFRYQFHDPRNIESDQTWHRTRWVVGTEYQINDKNVFSTYYLMQFEYNVVTPQDQYVIGLEYALTL